MSLLTNLPNFYNATAPNAADLNTWVEEVLKLIGGGGYSQSGGIFKTFAGGLGTQNFAASARFGAAQEVESRSIFAIVFESADLVLGGFECGPFPFDFDAFALTVVSDAAPVIDHGSLSILLDGRQATQVFGYVAAGANRAIGWDLDLVLRRKQVLTITNGLLDSGGVAIAKLRAHLWCTAEHVT